MLYANLSAFAIALPQDSSISFSPLRISAWQAGHFIAESSLIISSTLIPLLRAIDTRRVMVVILLVHPADGFANTSKISPSSVLLTVKYILSTQAVLSLYVAPPISFTPLRLIGVILSYLNSGSFLLTPKMFPRLQLSTNTVIPFNPCFQALT